MIHSRLPFELVLALLLAASLPAQTKPKKPAEPDKTAEAAIAKASPQSGFDRPAILVPADSDEIITTIPLRGIKPKSGKEPLNLDAGLLTSAQQPNFQVRPTVTVVGEPAAQADGAYLVTLKVSGLVVFGESSLTLLYEGKQFDVLRFLKTGLIVKPPTGDAFVVHEGERFTWNTLWGVDAFPQQSLLFVLENPSANAYESVRARLRFENQDVCLFAAETFDKPSADSAPKQSCESNNGWTNFKIPQYAQVSLRGTPSTAWFFDPNSGLAGSATRKGWLTLRFTKKDSDKIEEQNLPIEIKFEPSSVSIFRSLIYVALLLALGAFISLLIRVTVPNMKRKSLLKDQLNDLAQSISSISTEVDSNLRVMLRVERRVLDKLRTTVWSFGPGYEEYAKAVEQALPNLKRRVEAVRRLDAALIRNRALTEQGSAPTRLDQIDDMLSIASETLKQDRLSDEDWVFVNQKLEGAQKLLREPTQTEKEAFEAMLSNRWKAIYKHFKDANGVLTPPAILQSMRDCFPDPSLLPNAKEDPDGRQWLDEVGVVRADLQLSALSLVWDFQFLLPAAPTLPKKWADAMATLNTKLSTPAIDNLRDARRLLRELAEGISEQDIITALQSGNASILMDPSLPRPDRTILFSVHLHQANLNNAAARQTIACHWTFLDSYSLRFSRIGGWVRKTWWWATRKEHHGGKLGELLLQEEGWHVHHYFERNTYVSRVSVSFSDSQGNPIDLSNAKGWNSIIAKPQEIPFSQQLREKWQRSFLELTQLAAALLVPLATLASSTLTDGSAPPWWKLVAIGFGSDTIKNVLVGKDDSPNSTQAPMK